MSLVKRLNYLLGVSIFVSGLVFLIIWALPGDLFHKVWSYLATLGLALLPVVLRYVFKLKISDMLILGYYCFIIPAMIFGIDLDFYKTVPSFDKIVHLFSGVLAVFGARELLDGLKIKGKSANATRLIYILAPLCFAAFTAVIWECFEFCMDLFFGQHMQELISEGVADTMFDLISATVGGMVAACLIEFTRKKTDKIKN